MNDRTPTEGSTMDLCSDCKCKPGWHQLWCPRAQRVMTAMVRRLRQDEAEKQ